MSLTVGEVARLAGASVRALHHYDEIGLLRPSGRTRSGYRLYTDADLERLQQILFFRELGFALEDIARILADEAFDRRRALEAQRALLVEKGARLRAMVALIDRTMDAMDKGKTMKPDEIFEASSELDAAAYDEEVRQRWGATESYAESARRTKGYTKADWAAVRGEMDAFHEAFARALDAGARADSAEVMDLAERARLHIDRRFYPCSRAMHAALGQMYVADERFAATYEKIRPGLAQFVCDAIRANGARG